MKIPRLRVVITVLSASVLLILILGIFLLPKLIDSRWIRETVSSELQKKINGEVTLSKIAFLWFPRPTVQIDQAKISIDGNTEGTIRRMRIYPNIIAFLMGRVVVNRAVVEAPALRIHLPTASEKRFDLEELEEQVRSALVRLTTDSPAPHIELADGTAEVKIGDKPAVVFEDIAMQVAASPGDLRFNLSARSNLCEKATIEGKVLPEKPDLRLAIGIRRLRIKESLALLTLQISDYASDGEASFDVKISAAGLRDIEASIDGSFGHFVIVRHGEPTTLAAKKVKGTIQYDGELTDFKLEHLELEAPRLQALGELKVSSEFLSAFIQVRNADIAEVSHFALRLVDNPQRLEGITRYIPSGSIPEVTVRSAGRSLPELARFENLSVFGAMQNGKFVLPRVGFEFQNVSGAVQISAGILEAAGISGNSGATKARDGKLRLGLDGAAAPFHLDIALRTSAPEVHSILLKIVADEGFRSELLKLRELQGELSGRLILGDRLNAISPIVMISSANVSATYEPIPFPIAIRGGRLGYDHKIIKVENAQGSVGLSNFDGLDITLHRNGSRQIKLESRQMLLHVHQVDALLRRMKESRPYLEKLQSVRGQVELRGVAFSGPYDDPARWTFSAAGRLSEVEFMHEDYPGPIMLRRGTFAIDEARVSVSDAAAEVSDALLSGGGTFEYAHGGQRRIEISGTANLGPQMNQWLGHRIELPEELKLRSPINIVTEHFAWHERSDTAFRGRMTVAGGPQIAVDLVKQPQALAVHHLSVYDGDQRTQMALQLGDEKIDFSFSGEVSQQTIDKIFVSFPAKAGQLRGDIQVRAWLMDPIRVSADGYLEGLNLHIPIGTEQVLFERFSTVGSGDTMEVRSADVVWGKSRLALSGKLNGATEFLGVDFDIGADTLDWAGLQDSLGGRSVLQGGKSTGVMRIPDVQGAIRLKADRFRFEGFDVSPVETTVVIGRSGIRAEIKRGVLCGINTTGRIEFAGKEMKLDLQLSATDAQLGPTTICLTKRQNDVTGTYSATAHITGSGDRERLASSLNGGFQLTAHNGEFVRSPGIDAAFDYLNGTGDFKVAFPDLDREAFPYRLVSIKGRIAGKVLMGDEVNVASSLLNLSGQGKVDLERKEIDGKGLIAVLKPIDEVIGRIPLMRSIVGGSLLGIPVRVTGALERPDITYLSPVDVGAELLNVPIRILGMPLEAIKLFTPGGELLDKDTR